jgi:hypothetical protein
MTKRQTQYTRLRSGGREGRAVFDEGPDRNSVVLVRR